MNLSRITEKAKKMIDDRGGVDALKKDAAELKDIATGRGSIADKAKAAAAAIKDPGRAGDGPGRTGDGPGPAGDGPGSAGAEPPGPKAPGL